MTESVSRWTPAGGCLLFACDVVSYGDARRTDDVQEYLRAGLYRALGASFGHAGIPFEGIYLEDRGDGVISAVPHEHDPALLVTVVFDRLRAEIRRYNKLASEVARIRLRVSVHLGRAKYDGKGLIGRDTSHLCRMLDAPSFKHAMNEADSVVGLIVSERFFEDVVCTDSGVIDPDDYRRLRVAVKETDSVAWVRLPAPGAPPQPARPEGPAQPEGPVQPESRAEPEGQVRPEDRAQPENKVPSLLGDTALDRGTGRPAARAGGRPPRDADPRVAPAMAWAVLVHDVMAVPAMLVERTREAVVQALGPQIASVIPRSADARTDIIAIVKTCLDYRDGILRLAEAVRLVAGDTKSVQRLEETIAEYWEEL